MIFVDRLMTLDRCLCVRLEPWWLRMWWKRLWLRADENHPSLNHDCRIICGLRARYGMTSELEYEDARNGVLNEVSRYELDLRKRRAVTHERDLQRETIVFLNDTGPDAD